MTRLANTEYHNKYSEASQAIPRITVYFLQASRSIRIVWLLEELGIPYKLEFANREGQKAPQAFKDASGNPLGKFPTVKDGDLVVYESGNILEYLCERYDTGHRMISQNEYLRSRIKMFIHAAEGTILMHSLAVLYARWSLPASIKESQPEVVQQMESSLGVNVQKDLDWLEAELGRSTGRFLVGDTVTAADCMMHFSVQFAMERQLGTNGGGPWPRLQEWLERCENTEAYKVAVEKSGHTLHPKTT